MYYIYFTNSGRITLGARMSWCVCAYMLVFVDVLVRLCCTGVRRATVCSPRRCVLQEVCRVGGLLLSDGEQVPAVSERATDPEAR